MSLAHPARQTQGSTDRCPRDCLLFTLEKLTLTAQGLSLPGHWPGVKGTPGRLGFFSETLCDLCSCAFSAPYHRGDLGQGPFELRTVTSTL